MCHKGVRMSGDPFATPPGITNQTEAAETEKSPRGRLGGGDGLLGDQLERAEARVEGVYNRGFEDNGREWIVNREGRYNEAAIGAECQRRSGVIQCTVRRRGNEARG